MEKMNKFMSYARMNEIYEIIERQKREDLQAAKLMREVFISTGDVEWLNTDSFMIAAVQAMSVGFYTGDRTGCRKAYGFVENIIMHPFTCTIVQEPGCGEDRFEYKVVNQVATKPLEGMSYEMNGEWGKVVTELFYVMLDGKYTRENAFKFAKKLRDLYNKFVNML